jgi:uncharacterized protein (TIGR01244 family)
VKLFKIFSAAFLVGLLAMLTIVYASHPRPQAFSKAHEFAPGLFVTEQIRTSDIFAIKRAGYKTIVDIRPDGEAPDQAPSATMQQLAKANGLTFYYIPVQHGPIPDSAVRDLDKALASSTQPVLLYCHSGRRAARTLSLYEASRPNGPDATTIFSMVRSAGQSADDLTAEINERIARRNQPAEGAK